MPHNLSDEPKTGNIQIYPPFTPPRKKRKDKNRPIDWYDGPPNHNRDEEALWQAVIVQAIVDACGNNRKPEYMRHKNIAIQWLTGNSPDFIEVCLAAGLEPDLVRKRAKKALMQPSLWRLDHTKTDDHQRRRTMRSRSRKPAAAENAASPAPCQILYPYERTERKKP